MAKLVTLTVDEKDGAVESDLTGFQGKGCAAVQDAFENALGKATHSIKKAEYNRPCDTKTKLQNRS